MFEATYTYTRATARDAFRRLLWRHYGGALLGLLIAFVWIPVAAPVPELRWLSGFVAGYVVAVLGFIVSAYRSAIRIADLYASAPITLRLSAGSLSTESERGSSLSPWSAFKDVLSTSHYLVLRRKGFNQALTIPVSALSTDAVAYVLERVRQAGGRVRGA